MAEADFPVLFEDQRDPESCAMTGFKARERDAFDAHWRKNLSDPANLTRTILVDGEVAGFVSSFLRGPDREVCYWIGRSYWGRGVASRALAEFLKAESRRPLAARVAKRNPASRRVLEKCAFAKTGEDEWKTADGETIAEDVLELE